MPVRQTSKDAYKEVQDSGFIGDKQKYYYDLLYKYGPCTANELFRFGKRSNINQANVGTRLGELRDMGVVRELDKRECEVTLMKCIVWDVTDKMPLRPPKKLTKAEKKELVLSELRDLYSRESTGTTTKKALTKIANMIKEI